MLQRQWPGSPGVRDFLWHKERRLLALQVPSYHVRDRGLTCHIPSTADSVLRTAGNRQPPEISSSKTKQWGS